MATEMQTDTEPDRVCKEIIKKDQAAEDIILLPDKQLSVPGRDTGESQGPVGARTLRVLMVGNSTGLKEFVSGVMDQNSLRGVGVESKLAFCN